MDKKKKKKHSELLEATARIKRWTFIKQEPMDKIQDATLHTFKLI